MSDNENYIEFNESDNLLAICDDEGNEAQFELIDFIEHKGGSYVVLLPVAETDGMRETVILEVCGEDGDMQTFEWVENDALRDELFGIFKQHFAGEFDFTE